MKKQNTEKRLVVYKDVELTEETSSYNITRGDYEACVVINDKFNNNSASWMDIFDILRGDKLKSEIFKAEKFKSYTLKKGMEFNKFVHCPPDQHWTVYFHRMPKGKILALFKYTWNADTLSRHFVEVGEVINNAYDLKNISITCHGGVKVFNRSGWEVKSKNKASWICRVSSKDMSKSDAQKYLSAISKNIIVDSVEYSANNSGFHNFSTTTLYDLTISVSVENSSVESVSIKEVMKETCHNKYFKEKNKLYLIEEDTHEPSISILHIKDGVIDKCDSSYYYRFDDFLGKKIII